MKIDEIAKENPNWNNAGNEKLNNSKKKNKKHSVESLTKEWVM